MQYLKPGKRPREVLSEDDLDFIATKLAKLETPSKLEILEKLGRIKTSIM
jgi:hypothetical protein